MRGLVKLFDGLVAVSGVDLDVPAGSFFGLLGPNGAGKTTSLNMAVGLLRPTQGRAYVLGHDVWTDPVQAKRLLGVLPDGMRMFDRLTGPELLGYQGLLRGMPPDVIDQRAKELLDVFGLADSGRTLVVDYSAGMKKKIGLACALLHAPRVLVLDEPFEAVDPLSAATIRDIMTRYVAGGGTVIFSSHVLELVERLCTHVAILADGTIKAVGTLDEVRGGRSLEDVFVTTVGGQAAAPVRIRYFVRLKLRLVRNGLRGPGTRIFGFMAGLFFGFWLAVAGFFWFFLAGIEPRADVGLVIVAFTGSAIVLGWLLLPLLFFGVDETLDPARFALLPLPNRTLAFGMLAAACVGIPGIATALALAGAVAAAGIRGGAAALAVGLVGAALSLLLCVAASRAITSAFAGLLRSRRARDLTALLLALVAASVGPVQLLVNSLALHTSFAPVLRVARILGWTPLAAGFLAPYDVVDGRPLLAVVRLAIVAACVVGALWWWSRTLESAMLGVSSGGTASRGSVRWYRGCCASPGRTHSSASSRGSCGTGRGTRAAGPR